MRSPTPTTTHGSTGSPKGSMPGGATTEKKPTRLAVISQSFGCGRVSGSTHRGSGESPGDRKGYQYRVTHPGRVNDMSMSSPPSAVAQSSKALYRADALAGINPANVNKRPATHAGSA